MDKNNPCGFQQQGVSEYRDLLTHTLPSLHDEYCDLSDPESVSVLLQLTNHILSEAAKATNKHVVLKIAPKPRKASIPSEIESSVKKKELKLNYLNKIDADPSSLQADKDLARAEYKAAKSVHQNLVRKYNISKEINQDDEFHDIISKQPKQIFKTIKTEDLPNLQN